MIETIGEKISPILEEIEDALWEFEANIAEPPGFPIEGFRSSIKIFMSLFMERLYLHQQEKNSSQMIAEKEAQFYGEEIRILVQRATGIDTHDFYKKEKIK